MICPVVKWGNYTWIVHFMLLFIILGIMPYSVVKLTMRNVQFTLLIIFDCDAVLTTNLRRTLLVSLKTLKPTQQTTPSPKMLRNLLVGWTVVDTGLPQTLQPPLRSSSC